MVVWLEYGEGEIDWFLERVSHEPNYRNWQNLSPACLKYLIHTPQATLQLQSTTFSIELVSSNSYLETANLR